jgi:ADP-heptose:LPS heptosyltransferase
VAHPLSGDDRKNWPLGAWVSLIERLQPRGHRFVLVCSAAERARLGAALKSIPTEALQIKAGAPLRHVKAVIAKSRLLVGGDSGPGHMAAALGVPVVSLFGPGAPARSGPVGRAAVRFVAHDPLSALPLDAVESAVTETLESRVAGGNA